MASSRRSFLGRFTHKILLLVRSPSQMAVGVVYNPCSDELFQTVRGFGAYVNGERASSSGRSELGNAVVVRKSNLSVHGIPVTRCMELKVFEGKDSTRCGGIEETSVYISGVE